MKDQGFHEKIHGIKSLVILSLFWFILILYIYKIILEWLSGSNKCPIP